MMREGRNKKTFFCSMLLLVLLILFASIYYANTNTNTMPDALAIESNTLYSEIQIVCKELFGEDVNIRKAECLYNLDESADFIYVEFDSSGYAVFANQTLDILEYCNV